MQLTKKEENWIDFIFSKNFLRIFLKDKTITQNEYDECIKELEVIYLTEAGLDGRRR